MLISINLIRPNPDQPRKLFAGIHELAQSIIDKGLLEPIMIRPMGDGNYQIIHGERRWRACNEARLSEVEVVVREASDEEAYELALLENVQRQDLTPIEEAQAYQKLQDGGYTQTKVAHIIGRTQQYVASRLSLLRLSEPAQNLITTRVVSPSAGELLARIDDPEEQLRVARSIRDEKPTIRQLEKVLALTQQRLPPREGAVDLPEGLFAVIVADPPWMYVKRAEDFTQRGKCPYPPMSQEDLLALRIPAAQDCVLWLWTTNAFVRDAYDLAEAWGFEVKTILTWVKNRMGLGDWLRGQSEHCLMCVKGSPRIHLTNQTTVLMAPAREHSRKPDEFYALVESLCPGAKLEMFARQRRPGWEAHGDQVEKYYSPKTHSAGEDQIH